MCDDHAIRKEYVYEEAHDLNFAERSAYHLKEICMDAFHEDVRDSVSLAIYVFEPSVRWNDSLHTRELKDEKYFKNGSLTACLAIADVGADVILCAHHSTLESLTDLVTDLGKRGFTIKRGF